MSTAHDFDAIYAPNATFEDPLMRAQGLVTNQAPFAHNLDLCLGGIRF